MRRLAAIVFVSLVAAAVLAETGKPLTDLNLRTAPSARRSKVIAVLRTSDQFEILETRRGWCRVRLTNGVEGWVAQKYVSVLPDQPQPAPAVAEGSSEEGVATGGNMAIVAGLLAMIGYLTGYRLNEHGVLPPQTRTRPHPVGFGLVCLLLGSLYVILTLPKLLIVVGTNSAFLTLADVGHWGVAINARLASSLPAFPAVLRCIFWVTAFYLLSLLILGLRHGSLRLFKLGGLTLACSIPMFYLISWAGYVVVMIGAAVFWVLAGIFRIFGAVAAFFGRLVVRIITGIYDVLYLLMGELWWLATVGLALVLAVMFLRGRKDWAAILLGVGQLLLAASGVALIVYALRWIWTHIGPWVMRVLEFLGNVVRAIGIFVLRIALALGVLLVLATIGQLLIDQIQGALSAGRRVFGVVIGALAIGTSVAILLLVSNVQNVNAGLPSFVMEFAGAYLHQPAPLFDALIAFLVASLGVVGVWRNMPALGEEPTMQEFNKSLIYGALGVFVAGGLAALGGLTPDE